MPFLKKQKIPSLRSFITVTIALIVTATLSCSILFYYIKTANILTDNYRKDITEQLNYINSQITEQISSIDSIIPLYLSNTLILNVLESSDPENIYIENEFDIEKQMSYIYYSTSLSSKNFTNAIYILQNNKPLFSINPSGSSEPLFNQSQKLLKVIDTTDTQLICQMLPDENNHLFFTRNLFNSNTGKYMGTFVIDINIQRWLSYCAKNLDESWFICLHNSTVNISSDPDMKSECMQLQKLTNNQKTNISFQELALCDNTYLVASQKLKRVGLTSTVAASRTQLMQELNDTLKSYLVLLSGILLLALIVAIIISRAITKPIDKMIFHINQISKGESSKLPPMKMYQEFDIWADSFNKMLKQLDQYYNDNFQKQLLLKNSEIRALQTQMNPHFLFNVLNTIAWKAQISDNEEIYQMVISLGALLKANTLSKERDFIKLEQEIEYVKFYIYLQQMRFEDKISCSLQVPDALMQNMIPCFCIQPLVENAVVHGLEPKPTPGKLAVQILQTDSEHMEISIIDNGVGFPEDFKIRKISPSEHGKHTHVGLRNLDKRLELLFNSDSCLKIDSIPNVCTTISFKIPIIKEDSYDFQSTDR